MRVLLRHAGIGLYYAGHNHWVGNPGCAMDLGSIKRATEFSRDEAFEVMDIVVSYDDPSCERILQLRRESAVDAQTRRAPP